MKTLLLIVALGAAALSGQTITITGPNANVKAGSAVVLTVTLSGSAGVNVQALQYSITGFQGWTVAVADGAAATAASKFNTCAMVGTVLNCIAVGVNTNVWSDGVISTLTLTIPKRAASGTQTDTLGGLLGAVTDSSGNVTGVAITAGSPFALSIISPCDGITLAQMLPPVLGTAAYSAALDLNSDGVVNVEDAQIVADYSVSGVCAAN
jgi:hypothetical protein